MKLGALLASLLVGCSGGCSKPSPAAPQVIYSELVEAGCMQQTDGGLASVQQELGASSQPPWFQCLADGGTVASCGGCPK